MALDDDASDRQKFQDTKGNIFGTHGLISLWGGKGKRIWIKEEDRPIFTSWLCHSSAWSWTLSFKIQCLHLWNEGSTLYLLEKNPLERGLSQLEFFSWREILSGLLALFHLLYDASGSPCSFRGSTPPSSACCPFILMPGASRCRMAAAAPDIMPISFSAIPLTSGKQWSCHTPPLLPVSKFLFRPD